MYDAFVLFDKFVVINFVNAVNLSIESKCFTFSGNFLFVALVPFLPFLPDDPSVRGPHLL